MPTTYTPFSDDDENFQAAEAWRGQPEGVSAKADPVIDEILKADPRLTAARGHIPEELRRGSGRISVGEGTGFTASGHPISNSAAGQLPQHDPDLDLLDDADRNYVTSVLAKEEYAEDTAAFRRANPHLYS